MLYFTGKIFCKLAKKHGQTVTVRTHKGKLIKICTRCGEVIS